MPHSKGLQRIPILNRINLIPHIDTYFFEVLSNIPSYLGLRLPKGLFLVDFTNSEVQCRIRKGCKESPS